jgi:hypothetical protein
VFIQEKDHSYVTSVKEALEQDIVSKNINVLTQEKNHLNVTSVAGHTEINRVLLNMNILTKEKNSYVTSVKEAF